MKNYGELLLIAVLCFIVLVCVSCTGPDKITKVDNCDRVGGTSVTEYHTGELMCVTLEVIKL